MIDRFTRWLEALLVKLHLGRFAQFVKFGLVGVSNTLISLVVYWLTLNLLGWDKQVCNLVSFLVSVTNAYYWNYRVVFGRTYTLWEHVKAYARTVASYAVTGLILNGLLLALWVDVCGINANLAPLINLLVTIPLNFVLNKFWAFRDARKQPDAPAEPLQSDEDNV